ncbi:hypothetical protein [Streptomyces sp. F001]|nr:hypothetical protein [Streptomyces sp. F001]
MLEPLLLDGAMAQGRADEWWTLSRVNAGSLGTVMPFRSRTTVPSWSIR